MAGEARARLEALKAARPKPISAQYETLVQFTEGKGHGETPLFIASPSVPNVSVVGWAEGSRDDLKRRLRERGALLLRGFHVPDSETFRKLAVTLSGSLFDYTERAAPRTMVRPGVYTSTEFAADAYIPMHHEMSYAHQWPRTLFFHCEVAALSGGCTPISDDRKVFKEIPDRTKEMFLEKKVMYVRNFGYGVDLSWQEAFQTSDRRDVERYCESSGIQVEWRPDDCLRTRQVRQVVVTHPDTGETVWFNHAHLFHWSSLDPQTSSALFAQFDEEDFPRNAFFGDGSVIPVEMLEEIRAVYERMSIRFKWEAGDILMVDNILMSHGRDPFEGERRVLVAMADMHRATPV